MGICLKFYRSTFDSRDVSKTVSNDEETEDRDWIRHCFVYHLMCSDQRIRWKNA